MSRRPWAAVGSRRCPRSSRSRRLRSTTGTEPGWRIAQARPRQDGPGLLAATRTGLGRRPTSGDCNAARRPAPLGVRCRAPGGVQSVRCVGGRVVKESEPGHRPPPTRSDTKQARKSRLRRGEQRSPAAIVGAGGHLTPVRRRTNSAVRAHRQCQAVVAKQRGNAPDSANRDAGRCRWKRVRAESCQGPERYPTVYPIP